MVDDTGCSSRPLGRDIDGDMFRGLSVEVVWIWTSEGPKAEEGMGFGGLFQSEGRGVELAT